MSTRPPPPTRRIGELLVQRGLITSAQLERALAHQRATGQMLGTILVRFGEVKAEALLEAFSEQFGIPSEPLDLAHVDWSAARQFPESVLSQGRCFPIRADARSVTVAITNPLDASALSEMQRTAGARAVKPVLVLERELRSVQQEHTRRTLRALEAQLGDYGDGKIQ